MCADCPIDQIRSLMELTKGAFENILISCTETATPQLQVLPTAEQSSLQHPRRQHQEQQASLAIAHSATDHQHRLKQVYPHKWKKFLPLYCHCGKTVQWQRGWALCGKHGDSKRHKVYQQKVNCCHCQRRFEFTPNMRNHNQTWCPYQRACPLCKADFHSAACMPAPKTTVSVH